MGKEQENSYENILSNENYRSGDGEKGKIYKDPSIVRDRLSSRNPSVSLKRGINTLLARRQREIENEIEEYLNMYKKKDMEKGYEMSSGNILFLILSAGHTDTFTL